MNIQETKVSKWIFKNFLSFLQDKNELYWYPLLKWQLIKKLLAKGQILHNTKKWHTHMFNPIMFS